MIIIGLIKKNLLEVGHGLKKYSGRLRLAHVDGKATGKMKQLLHYQENILKI